MEDLLLGLARAWFDRAGDLRKLDQAREANPLWFQSNQMLGGVCYVDRFAGNLDGLIVMSLALEEKDRNRLHDKEIETVLIEYSHPNSTISMLRNTLT